jgi:hypothetical protein
MKRREMFWRKGWRMVGSVAEPAKMEVGRLGSESIEGKVVRSFS